MLRPYCFLFLHLGLSLKLPYIFLCYLYLNSNKYLSKINYTYLTPPLPLAFCLLPFFTRKFILHDYLMTFDKLDGIATFFGSIKVSKRNFFGEDRSFSRQKNRTLPEIFAKILTVERTTDSAKLTLSVN